MENLEKLWKIYKATDYTQLKSSLTDQRIFNKNLSHPGASSLIVKILFCQLDSFLLWIGLEHTCWIVNCKLGVWMVSFLVLRSQSQLTLLLIKRVWIRNLVDILFLESRYQNQKDVLLKVYYNLINFAIIV